MTVFASSGLTVKASKRFMADVRSLPDPIAKKVDRVVRNLLDHGTHYGGLETRKIAGNPDDRFRLMDVDYSYRIVAAIEDRHVFLEKVGPHDPTERWGEQATLRDYEERLEVGRATLTSSAKDLAEQTAEMFEIRPSLKEIDESGTATDVLGDCLPGVMDGWNDGTLEDWMIFLSPVQSRAVERAVAGPSRVTGGPGTGKTVVGLHRAKAFAEELEGDGRVLLTSFVSTIPKVLEGLFERLAPDLAHRADFATVHALARRELGEERFARVDGESARRRFNARLTTDPGRYRQLRQGAGFSDDYLWEEVTRVIIGRGVERREDYLALQRHGRRRRMPTMIRSLVWDIYEEYLDACAERDAVIDWNLMLRYALEHVREQGPSRRYSAIVVDEAQDITEVGVRFLIELLEAGPKGRLMLIGDSGQRIYPGGYRLADLGLETRGRSFALDVCYRSTDEIMQAVGSLGRFLSTEEFGEDGQRGMSMNTVRFGERPVVRGFRTRDEERAWIVGTLDPDDPAMDSTAILVYTNRQVDSWRAALKDAGIGSVALGDYSGRPIPGVKVGTYHRAKGLEFERVFLPGLDDGYPFGNHDDDAIVEHGSVLYVAMSRARDQLRLSYSGTPSMLLEPVLEKCNQAETASTT